MTEESKYMLNALKKYIKLWREGDRLYAGWFKGRPCSDAEFRILDLLLASGKAMEPSEIADILGFPRQTMTYMLDTQESAGRLERLPHPTDRRRKLIKLTAAGKVFAENETRLLTARELQAIMGFGASEMETLNTLAQRFNDLLGLAFREEKAGGNADHESGRQYKKVYDKEL
jgi:DNA-binding MarR family transcriptional regulator